MPRPIQAALAYLGHLVVAILGTAMLQTFISSLLPLPISRNQLLARALLVGAMVALALGLLGSWLKPTRTAYWIWVLPLAVLLVHTIGVVNGSSGSVLGAHPHSWRDLLGVELERGHPWNGLVNYTLFVAPTVRTIAYSIGAFAAAQVRSAQNTSEANAAAGSH